MAARYLILPLVVFVSCLVWIRQEKNKELAQYSAELESYVVDSEATQKAVTSTVDGLIRRQEFVQEPVSRDGWYTLWEAQKFFARRLDRPRSRVLDPGERILDLCYFIELSWKIRRFHDAENALVELLSLTSNDDKTSPELLSRRIRALNWQSCLLANYREPNVALETALKCIDSCQKFLDGQPGNSMIQGLLARALRNAGVIEEVLGRDGVQYVKRAAEIAVLLPNDDVSVPVSAHLALSAFVVDTKQMLGSLHLRHGRRDKAMAAWLDALNECQNLVLRAENLSQQQPFSVPALKFQKAKRRLECDIEQLKRLSVETIGISAIHEGEGHGTGSRTTASVAQWTWTPLSLDDGLSELPIDLLVNAVLPGEFEPQEAILVAWTADNSWSRPASLKMVEAIQETTSVVILVPNEEVLEEAVEEISGNGMPLDRIEFVTLETDTIWTRDFGPLIVKCDDGAVRIARCMFRDSFEEPTPANDYLSLAWARATGWPVFRLPAMIEAGALLSNGDGLCLASEYLLAKNSASGIAERQVTDALKRLTGAKQVVYLLPLIGEETGHVDWFATFTSPDTVVVGDYYGVDDVNSKILDENARRLSGIVTRSGPLRVERIPMPPRGKDYFGGTYTNVVFANGNLLVPTWPEASRKTEKKAIDVYRRLLPDWKIIPIDSQQLGRKLGSLHCATMNLHRHRPPKSPICSPRH